MSLPHPGLVLPGGDDVWVMGFMPPFVVISIKESDELTGVAFAGVAKFLEARRTFQNLCIM
jgi:hypothetical protein